MRCLGGAAGTAGNSGVLVASYPDEIHGHRYCPTHTLVISFTFSLLPSQKYLLHIVDIHIDLIGCRMLLLAST